MDYIDFNPVKHGLATYHADWPVSSLDRSALADLYGAVRIWRDFHNGA
jgi:hypothetical protein